MEFYDVYLVQNACKLYYVQEVSQDFPMLAQDILILLLNFRITEIEELLSRIWKQRS
jgi:hypothetical protein